MINLITEAASLQKFLEEKHWEFYFIGGLTVQVWGQLRLTQDIDVTLFTNLRNETEYISALLELYSPKFADAGQFALTHRVLPVFTKTGIGIDITLSGLSAGNEALERASYQQFTPEISLRICSAEDLIIMKTVAARPRDWVDIESVIIKQMDLDWPYIDKIIQSLDAYDDISSRVTQLQSLKEQFYRK